jgi:lambda family phage tail tape measure protein
MAKQIEDIVVQLGIQGFEELNKLRSSFRELTKVTRGTDDQLDAARKRLLELKTELGDTARANKGLTDAFTALVGEARRGSDVWQSLNKDLAQLRQESRLTDTQITALRDIIVDESKAHAQSAVSIREHVKSLQDLRNQATLNGKVHQQLGADIQRLTATLEQGEITNRKHYSSLTAILAVKPDKVLKQWEDYNRILKEGTASADKLATAQRRLNQLSGAPRILERRRVSESAAITQDPEYLRRFGFEGASLPELPNTNAAYAQQIKELQQDLANLDRNSIEYLQTLMQLTGVQRQSTEVARGYAQALLMGVQTKTVANSTRNLQEVVTALRAEMQQLDTTTSEGSAAYAQNANQVRVLEKQLNDLAGAYRNVSTMATQAATAEQNAANARIRDNYLNRGMVRQQEAALAELGQRVRAGVAATPLLLPAAGQTSARGTGLEISAGEGVRVRRGRAPGAIQQIFAPGSGVGGVRFPGEQERLQPTATAEEADRARRTYIAETDARRANAEAVEQQRQRMEALRASVDKATKANTGSINSLGNLREALANLRNEIPATNGEFKQLTNRLQDVDVRSERLSTRASRRLSGMQLAQGVGAALSGGIFGGPEGLIGGLGGLAVGGVGGAFAGAAAGAQVGMFRQQLGTVTDYSARIDKLQIALRGIVGSQDAYSQALSAAASVTRDLNIPQEVAIQGMTRLSAAVKGAGGTVSDSAFAFRAVSEAVKATGGNAEQADGALLALTQVFSKGKVSAEELNQIAERLPGTFTLFAKAAGMTGPQLQKALQEGQVGLNDLMKFLQLISTNYGQTALKIAGSSQEAGARLSVAMKNMQLEVGRALQPIGASLQSAFAEFVTTITPSVVAALKGIAAAFEFLIENKTASGLATFALQLGAVTLGFIGLKAALEGLATIKVLALFTSTSSAVKITGDVAATSALSVRGLSAALAAVPGFGWVAAGTAALGLLGAALYDNNKEFKTWVDSFLYIIKTDFESAWRIAVDIVKTNVKVITDTWEAAKNILTNTAGALVTSFDSTFNGIFSGILKRWQSLPEPLRKAMAQGGAQTVGMVLAPGNPVIGRLIGTGIRATQERPPVALADTGRYVPGSAQQRFPGQLSAFPTPATDDEKKRKAAADKAARDAQAAAAEQQRLANTLLDQQLRAADRVFQHQIELDRQRYELQKRLDDAQAQNRILRETGAARDIVSNFEDLQRSLREIEERRVRAVQDVRLAKQTQQSAAIRATFDAQGAAMLRAGGTGISATAIAKATAEAAKFTGIANQCSESVKSFYKSLGITLPGVTAWADTVRNAGTVMRDWSKLRPGDIVATGRPGDTPHVGVYTGGNNVFHQSRKRGLTAGNYPDLDYFKSGYFVRPTQSAGTARMPAGAAAQQNRAIRSSGGAVLEGLDVTQAEAQQQLIEANVAKERAALFEQFTLKATDALRQQNATMRDSNELQTLRNRLTLEGVRPEFIDLEERLLGLRKEQSQEQTTYNQLVADNPDRKDELQRALAAQNEQYAERARLLRENAEAAEAFDKAMRTRQDERIGLGLREGAEAYVQSIGTMREATAQLAQTGIKGVEDAIFSLVTTGTANFREFAASILRDTARMIIQQLILRSVMQIFNFLPGGSPVSALVPGMPFDPASIPGMAFAYGGVFAKNNVVPFAMGGTFPRNVTAYAMGGIVAKPTLFPFANGGAGRLGLMGEAGPEAIMPLRRLPSGRLGVEAGGAGTGVVVNVNVDAKGTAVESDQSSGQALGAVVGAAVRAEIVQQQRPGGLLDSSRRR